MHTPSFPWDPPAYEDAKPAEGGSPQWDKANHYHTLGRKTHTKAHIHFVLLIRKKERKKESIPCVSLSVYFPPNISVLPHFSKD